MRIESSRYNAPMMFLHWFIFLLFVIMYALIEIREYFPKEDPTRTTLILLHKSIGVGIFALVICRLLLRWLSPKPPIYPALTTFNQRLATGGHYALYAVMLIMPISGYIMSTAGGRPVAFFGLLLPRLLQENEGLSDNAYNIHVWVSLLIYGLVGLHILIALWHHFVRKDNTLIRMLPSKNRRS